MEHVARTNIYIYFHAVQNIITCSELIFSIKNDADDDDNGRGVDDDEKQWKEILRWLPPYRMHDRKQFFDGSKRERESVSVAG